MGIYGGLVSLGGNAKTEYEENATGAMKAKVPKRFELAKLFSRLFAAKKKSAFSQLQQ